MLALRVLTGAALTAVTPISQSVVADIATAEQRGRQFGLIGASDNLGSLLGGIFATTVGGMYELSGLAPGTYSVVARASVQLLQADLELVEQLVDVELHDDEVGRASLGVVLGGV